MHLANEGRRESLKQKALEVLPKLEEGELKNLLEDWLLHFFEGEGTRQRSTKLIAALEDALKQTNDADIKALYLEKDLFVKPSQWLIGGDGWAYDIGFSGIDHILSTGADVNILVLDNELYANTGGQMSKSTPPSAVEKFAAAGKFNNKKDLGMMAMSYGHVYVAQIASGANQMQTIKAIEEAEKYPGPSLIIAYVPCVVHGLKGGMSQSLKEAQEAVNSGYWSLYRYNPELEDLGKNPMSLDFKKPDFSLIPDFLRTQTRFSALELVHPEYSAELYERSVSDAKRRFFSYARLTGQEEKIRERIEKATEKKVVVEKNSTEVEKPVRREREKREKVATPSSEEARLRREERRKARQEKRKENNQ